MLLTVFDQHGNDRLTAWKEFRERLEVSSTPMEDVAILWSRAPFVSPYLNPQNPAEWPDPWHLIADGRFDELAIVIGMLYTIKLTQRFMNSNLEIHTSTPPNETEARYILIVDKQYVLNLEYRTVNAFAALETMKTSLVCAK
jgi:hypothetical protein